MMKDPAEQFQIGENVVYQPEGVVAQVVGYVWHEQMGELPTVAAYALSCGISVPGSALVREEDARARRIRSALREPTKRFRL